MKHETHTKSWPAPSCPHILTNNDRDWKWKSGWVPNECGVVGIMQDAAVTILQFVHGGVVHQRRIIGSGTRLSAVRAAHRFAREVAGKKGKKQ